MFLARCTESRGEDWADSKRFMGSAFTVTTITGFTTGHHRYFCQEHPYFFGSKGREEG